MVHLQKMRNEGVKSNYTNLDVLRSLAVLSVVSQHLWHQSVNFHLCSYDPNINQLLGNLSFTGVMFFFVHTCLVLMLSMHRSPKESLARNFLIRRAFRIYPLCWFTIAIALLTGFTDQAGGNFHSLGWLGVTVNAVLIQNVFRTFPSVVGPLWSLPWEVQMYLLLPAFFLLLRRFNGLATSIALWAVSACLSIVCTASSFPRMFHSAVFPPMFISGMVAYKLLTKSGQRSRRTYLPGWMWPFFVIALFAVKDRLAGPHNFESPIGAGINSLVCLVLAIAIPAFGELQTAWIAEIPRQIAKYSYGIYLLHVPSIIVAMRYFPGHSAAIKAAESLALTGVASYIVFHLVENPLIQFGKGVTRKLSEEDLAAPQYDSRLVALRYDIPTPQLSAPLVSIITPVYNAACWLPETLACVRAQTLADWEQILVDDGSTDNSVEIIEAAAREDSRFRLLRSPSNGGPSAARNQALNAAQGRFIAFLDADDLWLPEKLTRCIDWMTSHNYAFIYHDYRHMSNDGARLGKLVKAPELLDLHTLHTRRGHGGCLSVVIDRAQAPDFRFPTDHQYLHEDFRAWLSLIQQGHCGHRLPVDLGRYRLSSSSRSANRLVGSIHTWRIYREYSKLPLLRAAWWWSEYAWNSFWLHRRAAPRLAAHRVDVPKTVVS